MYSAMLSLKGEKVTIVGGGKVAFRKASLLFAEGCEIQVIAPNFIEEFKSLGCEVNRVYKNYEEGDCAGSRLVFAATDDKAVNESVAQYCKRANILCNVSDQPELSTFITPAQFKRGELTIAVSTGGNSPSLASKIKEDLGKLYGEDYGNYVELLGKLREEIINKEQNREKRKQMLNEIAQLDFSALQHYNIEERLKAQ